jgi:hypothetical protein
MRFKVYFKLNVDVTFPKFHMEDISEMIEVESDKGCQLIEVLLV